MSAKQEILTALLKGVTAAHKPEVICKVAHLQIAGVGHVVPADNEGEFVRLPRLELLHAIEEAAASNGVEVPAPAVEPVADNQADVVVPESDV